MLDQDYYTLPETAEILDCSLEQIKRYIVTEKIKLSVLHDGYVMLGKRNHDYSGHQGVFRGISREIEGYTGLLNVPTNYMSLYGQICTSSGIYMTTKYQYQEPTLEIGLQVQAPVFANGELFDKAMKEERENPDLVHFGHDVFNLNDSICVISKDELEIIYKPSHPLNTDGNLLPITEPKTKDDIYFFMRDCIKVFENQKKCTPIFNKLWPILLATDNDYGIKGDKAHGKNVLVVDGAIKTRKIIQQRYSRLYKK